MKKIISVLLLTGLVFVTLSGCDNTTSAVVVTPDITNPVLPTEPVETKPVVVEPEIEPVTITLTAIGDMLMHQGVSVPGLQKDGTYIYDYLFEHVKEKIVAADVAIVNEEVMFGGDHLGNLGYPCFNVNSALGTGLVDAGFDVVLFATNHTRDQHISGIQNTLDFWKLKHPDTTILGIHEDEASYNSITVLDIKGIKVAMLNYTYNLNGFKLGEGEKHYVDLMDEEHKDKIKSDLKRAEQMSDIVVVFPHWGTEYVLEETAEEQAWAQFFCENGADLIIGTHPHVIQPVKWVESSNGNKALVYYSLGNFVSCQPRNYTMLGGMAQVSITKDKTGTYVSAYDMDFLFTHYNVSRSHVTTYFLDDYTDELMKEHALVLTPTASLNWINKQYPMTVKDMKKLAEQVCPELADYEDIE